MTEEKNRNQIDKCFWPLQTRSIICWKRWPSDAIVSAGQFSYNGRQSRDSSLQAPNQTPTPVTMTTLQFLDIAIDVPDGTRCTRDPPQECRVVYTLDGPSVHNVRSTFEDAAQARGYDLRRTNRVTYVQRGERRLEIYDIQPSRIGIRVDDAGALPVAKVSQLGIELAGLVLPIPEAGEVQPGRERHDMGSTTWSAEWRIYGNKAIDVASSLHDALIRMGLRSGGVWPPPAGGIQRWKVEAYSSKQLVQVGITDSGDHLDLNLTVIADE